MEKEPIIQFVCFETTGDSAEFISQWDKYVKGMSDKQKIRLLRETGIRKTSRYLSKHKCYADEFKFIFKKARRSARFPEIEMRVRQLGGYTVVQLEYDHDSEPDENAVYVFVNNTKGDLDDYRRLPNYRYLNIYKAYFESSTYDYILEFFADKNHAHELMQQLKSQDRHFELGMYKECLLQGV